MKSGAKRANAPTDKDGAIWSPDADDPLYAKYWSALVVEAGKRYDGHPDLNHVDVSTVGYWGEGWGPYLPSWPVQQQLIDVYFKAFPRTLLLMNFDALPALQYGVKRGAGWRLDCWGDMGAPGRTFAHMKDFYPQQLARGGLQDAWRTAGRARNLLGARAMAPVEVPAEADPRPGAPLARLDDQHQVEPDSRRVEDGIRRVPETDRLPLRAEAARVPVAGGARRSMAPMNMWWFNAGVAPVYRSYTLALAIGEAVVPLDADVRRWLPGDAVVENTIAGAARRWHRDAIPLRVALLDPVTRRPAIHLAIAGRQDDGWYQVGEIRRRLQHSTGEDVGERRALKGAKA